MISTWSRELRDRVCLSGDLTSMLTVEEESAPGAKLALSQHLDSCPELVERLLADSID